MMEWKQWEGRVIDGRFHLRQYLGGSAHSGVFLTEYGEGTPQKAAIKLVPADSGKAHVWILRRELTARLSHPGLLSIFHFGSCQLDGTGLVYVVMEHSEEDLSQVIPVRPLTPAEAREMLMAVVETLAYLHKEGFVHGCLTPANILAAGDRVKLSSDGLLRIGESGDDSFAPGVNGPPESRAGMTRAGDVWSLGMTLVEVLTQRAPEWDGMAANDPVVPDTLAEPFLDIARGCLRSKPRLRCSLAEIAQALQPASPAPQKRLNFVETVPVAKPAAPAPETKRRFVLPVAGAFMLATIMTGGLLTSVRFVGSSAATGSRLPAPPQPPTVDTGTIPAAPRAAEPAPNHASKASDASRSAPEPAPSVSGADHSVGSPGTGDVVYRFVPEVPREILRTIRGMVKVSVRVQTDQSGDVVDAQIASRPGSKYFDRVTLDAARRWRFKPASGEGHDTAIARLVRFECRKNGCVAAADKTRR